MSGTHGGEWQPASDQVNDFGCRQRARECLTDLMNYPSAACEAAWLAVGRNLLHPLTLWLATDAGRAAQPR